MGFFVEISQRYFFRCSTEYRYLAASKLKAFTEVTNKPDRLYQMKGKPRIVQN